MAETFFRCAIEAGDAEVARSLLTWKGTGITANNQICVFDGQQYTPFERAASLQYLQLTEVLVEFGADANKTYCASTPCDFSAPRGALEHALETFPQRNVECGELISVIVQRGGDLSCWALKRALKRAPRNVVSIILLSGILSSHRLWAGSRVFHEAAHLCDADLVVDMIEVMQSIGVSLNQVYDKIGDIREFKRGAPVWLIPPYPPSIIDIVAQRGELDLVRLLHALNAVLTWNTLTAGVRSGNVELVRFLVSQGAKVDDFSHHYRSTPYAEAIRLRNRHILALLESEGCCKRIREEYHLCAALAAAAETGNAQKIRELLALSPSRNMLGWALNKAVQFDKTSVALMLLNSGAATDYNRYTAVFGYDTHLIGDLEWQKYPEFQVTFLLHIAIINKNAVIVRALIDHDTNLNNWMYGATPLQLALLWNERSIIRDMISAGALLQRSRFVGEHDMGSLVGIAWKMKDVDCAQYLLLAGADLNDGGHAGLGPPLAEAVRAVDVDMARWLLANGADPSDNISLSAAIKASTDMLHLLLGSIRGLPLGSGKAIEARILNKAIETRQVDIVHSLLHCGLHIRMDPDQEFIDKTYRTPLATAIQLGDDTGLEIVQMILSRTADVNRVIAWEDHPPNSGNCLSKETALLIAIGTKHAGMVQFLLDSGADINLPATRGIKRTPLQKACEVGCRSTIQLLLDQGAHINAPPAERSGGTALQLAAIKGCLGLVEFLLEENAHVNAAAANVNGRTALEGAAEHGRFDTVQYLHAHCSIEHEQYGRAARLARDNGHNAIAEMLESFSVNLQSIACTTPAYLCQTCRESLSNISALRRHERTVHKKESDFECDQFKKRFGRRDILKRHRKSHTKIDFVSCRSCGKSFRKDYLRLHSRTCRPV